MKNQEFTNPFPSEATSLAASIADFTSRKGICGVLKMAMQSPFHYVYKTTHKITGEFYIGVRKSYVSPQVDKYKGSGVWILFMCADPENLQKEIIGTFRSREEANHNELFHILRNIKNPLCRNRKSNIAMMV